MKVLLVNKFHWLKGGSETYYFELGKMLKEHGHEVAYFSMYDEKNIKTGDREYFVEPSDMNSKNVFKAFDIIYNKKNRKLMDKALEEFKPDIVHLNNFQRQLSASIIDSCKKHNVPIVYTAHDVQAICPAILMMDNDKNICEMCKQGKYVNCIKKKCIKVSLLKSILGSYESSYYRKHKIYADKIDFIVTPSEFYKQKFLEDGISSSKITAIHNFINVNEYDVDTQDDGYALYLGRLSREKGILNLIEAFSKTQKGILHIAGNGPELDKIKTIIKAKNIENRVKLLGFLNKEEVKEEVRRAKFIVVPSIWYENCPYSVIEAQSIGKAIIGADIGGIPELVKDNENGLIYRYDDIDALADKMNKLYDDEKIVEKYAKDAKSKAKVEYSPECYYEKIINIYTQLIER